MDSNFIKKYTLNKQVCPINFKPTEAYIYIYIYMQKSNFLLLRRGKGRWLQYNEAWNICIRYKGDFLTVSGIEHWSDLSNFFF